MRLSICLAITMLLSFGLGFAQSERIPDCFENTISASALSMGNTEIRLKTSDIIGGKVVGDTLFLFGDGPVKFPIELVNRDTVVYGGSSYFQIGSPDGATWAHATANGGNLKSLPSTMFGIWVDTTGVYSKSEFGGLYKFNLFGADGAGWDSIGFSLAPNDAAQTGIRPQDSGIFFYAIIRAKLADTGKHICIDSVSNRPPGCGCWKWPSFNYQPAYNAYPVWNGPYCFVLAKHPCCSGLAGNYDCDPEDRCDISDVVRFVERYTTLALPCCPEEANIDGSPDGRSDISDLSQLIDYLYVSFTPPKPCR